MRVFELAKKVGVTSKELISELNKLGATVKNHMIALDDNYVHLILKRYKAGKKDDTEPREEEVKRARVLVKRKVSTEEAVQSPATVITVQEPEVERLEVDRLSDVVLEEAEPEVAAKGVVAEVEPEAAPLETQVKPEITEVKPVQKAGVLELGKIEFDDKAKDKIKKKVKTKQTKEEFSYDFRQEPKPWQGIRTSFRRDDRGKKKQASNLLEITKPRKKVIKFNEGITVKEFADLIGHKATEVIKKLMEIGGMSNINQPIDLDAAILIAENFGLKVEAVSEKSGEEILEPVMDDLASLLPRPPVVTIMGHVDHGKTSLLDAIRQTNVTESEAGGITQHIGAYTVNVGDKKVVFLDTPGHEAFTAMRARGAKVTDIVVLVVAADDGVMPQTVEAINHARAANVPIIIAINKIDKPDANPERVKQKLADYNLLPESWGGQTIFAEVSAKKKIGLEHLLEMLLLQAELLELKANPNKLGRGTIVEAKIDKGRGVVATVLVQEGTLSVGDAFVAGTQFGKVRALLDDKGRRIDKATPSIPVEVIGFSGVPNAGDPYTVVDDERVAREIASSRTQRQRLVQQAQQKRVTLEDLYSQIKDGAVKELNIIIKADVQGSAEALKEALEKLSTEAVKLKTIHEGVGGIIETDVLLASASNAIIIGFNIRPEPKAQLLAERENVDIRLYTVIYDAIGDVRAAMEGLLEPTLKERILGRAEVRQTFNVPKAGLVAGVYVTDGVATRSSAGARVIRDSVTVYEGKISSLRRFKEDAREVQAGYECGIGIENFNDIKTGDIIEIYTFDKITAKL